MKQNLSNLELKNIIRLKLYVLLTLKKLATGLLKVHNHIKLVSPFEYLLELENGIVCQNSKK